MPCKFTVGDVVRLNNHGLQQCFGNSGAGFEQMLLKEYAITKTGNDSMTEPDETFAVEVDDLALNKLMIDDRCFDLVRSRGGFFGAPKDIDDARLTDAVTSAVSSFWDGIARSYPEAITGDLSPEMTVLLDQTAKAAASAWVRSNVPDIEPKVEGKSSYAW